MASTIVGLDIGRDSLKAVELEDAQKAHPKVVRYHELDLPVGAVQSGEVREVHTVASALKRLWVAGGFKSKNVILGMGNQRVLARDLTVPKMSLSQIRESLQFQVQDMLPVPVAEALLDFYPVSESVGESGPVINGLLIAAVKETVMANVTAVRLAGLVPLEVDLIPFALARVFAPQPTTGTVALVDIGGTTTNVVVVTDGVPQFVRIIPAGGDDVTNALVAGLSLTVRQAEELKRALGLAAAAVIEDRPAVELIYEATSELLGSLRNTLSYYANSRATQSLSQIILSGGGAQMVGLGAALSEMTRLPVVEGNPMERFAMARSAPGGGVQMRQSMTVALGLALGSAA